MKKKLVSLTLICIFISAQVTPQNVKEAIYTIDPSIPSFFHIPVEISKRMQGKDIKTGNSGLFLMELLQLNQDVSVVIVDTLTDVNGGFHESYKELYKGIEVEGTRCTIHYDKNGLPTYVNGNFRIISLGTISPEISEQHALSQAINNIGAKKYVWEDSVYNRKNQNLFNKRDFSHNPKGSLVIIYSDGKPHLAYKFHIWAIDPESHNQVYIDAETGQVLERYNMKCNIQASVQTLLSGQRNIQTQYYSSNYRLRDYNRGDGIETYKYTPFGDDYISSDNTWTDLSYNDRAALDAHWGLETTYDFYYNKFGRNSYDNNGATIVSYVYRPGYYNASWYTDYHYIEFGEGVNYPLVCLDVAAHEFTHAVTGATSNLGVQDESQAINEGLSDIFAVCVENQAKPLKGDSIWFIAEEDSIIRDIIHPTCKFYRGLGWNYLNYDEGHINSGVFSYWFYLLAHGGSGINEANYPYSISGIGLDMAIQICYLMNCAYLTSNSTFFDARMCSILAAEQLGYNTSVIAQIEEAWFVVGVRDMSIVGDYYYCDSNVYSIPNLPSGVTSVVWSLSGNEASKFNVLNETPVIHQCKLKKKMMQYSVHPLSA